jgi:hypothetical protein
VPADPGEIVAAAM